jgi:hypothetical protein
VPEATVLVTPDTSSANAVPVDVRQAMPTTTIKMVAVPGDRDGSFLRYILPANKTRN